MTDPARRPAHDRCPGVFDPHPAADGALARIRLLGGTIGSEQMQTVAQVAAEFGDGFVELTGRANLQIRGIGDVDAVADALTDAGLVPSSSHEKVRNIEVSAVTGRIGGLGDLRPTATAQDAAIRADPALSELSGRFLFGLDDGHGDIVTRGPDAAAVLRGDPGHGASAADIVLDGEVVGSVTDVADIPAALTAVAADMVEVGRGGRAWRIRDLDAAARAELGARARDRLSAPVDESLPDAPTSPIVGWFTQDDERVLLGAVVELGRLPARLGEFLAAVEAPIVITPDREILLCDLTEGVAETVVRVLAPMGLIFDASSPWAQVSCCAGSPGCAKGLSPVRADVLERVSSGEPITAREHWVGCARGCGTPPGPHLRVEATADGYRREQR
ncbi:precorrin-3B synthase [Gordonia sp. NB41Y]|uniref:precorrin-3B synthase n=1 Tax=Gordonia sp. NB41Y TaxID=875808 RepID=UPI0006B146D5|nr:precorrin-3B synthase [Gordonia sp. NB41Y]EMP10455.2 precorrin-3B synthase [Gordonia sp. NB41Y]WLP90859.1 precorrin-3B synthase [Gordonia sp. NB41Y]